MSSSDVNECKPLPGTHTPTQLKPCCFCACTPRYERRALDSSIRSFSAARAISAARQGLTLVHFSAQLEPYLTHKNALLTRNTP